ncbi:MAG: hypothetical protein ACRDVK_10835, partial [Acidimicrobiia bacterium]
MADFESKLRRLSERGNPVGVEELIERIEAELAGDPFVVLAKRREGLHMNKTDQTTKTQRPRKLRAMGWAAGIVALAAVVAVPLLLRDSSGRGVAALPTGTTTTLILGAPTVIYPDGRVGPGAQLTVMMPTGWVTWPSNSSIPSSIIKGDPEPPNWMAVGAISVADIYTDRCQWQGAVLNPPLGPTVDDLAIALAEVWGADATAPIDITLDGFAGTQIVLTVPTDVDFADCDNGQFRRFPGFWYQGQGQIDRMWILDVEGERLVVLASFFPEG